MRVRPREPTDLDKCVELLREVHAADGYPLRWPADPRRWLSPAGLRVAFVAELDHSLLVGHAILVDEPHVPAEGRSTRAAEISRLYVSPAIRRGGVGSALLDKVVAEGLRLKRRLWLQVVEGRGDAEHLYEARGWRLVERTTANWSTPTGERPAVLRYEFPSSDTDADASMSGSELSPPRAH
jgi:GNAT superfamily N-acetyltransferase